MTHPSGTAATHLDILEETLGLLGQVSTDQDRLDQLLETHFRVYNNNQPSEALEMTLSA
jgi:hypothetical protein